jgi:hypothetical protein
MNELIYSKTKLDNLYLIYPKIDLFLDAIDKNNNITFSKISIGWWETLRASLINTKISAREIQNNINILSEEMVKSWENTKAKDPNFIACKEVFPLVLSSITKPQPNNFLFGFTDRTPEKQFYLNKKKEYPDYKSNRQKFVLKLMNEILPKNTDIFDAMCWKYWCMYGSFKRIIDIANDKNIPIIIIGPNHLKSFGKKCNIKNYDYIEIDKNKASFYMNMKIKLYPTIQLYRVKKYT